MSDGDRSVVGESLPPRKSDVLFGSGSDWTVDACVNGIDDAIAYQDGYRRGALHLAEYVCDTGRGQDFLVYPVVYLYRHHIELTLKSIINLAFFLVDQKPTEKDIDTLGRHDLTKLWELGKSLLDPVCKLGRSSALPQEDIEGIDSYILQLHKHDPDGQRFRYSMTKPTARKSRLPSLPYLEHVNIRQFAVAMEKLADYLESLDNWFGDLVEAKSFYLIRKDMNRE